jgi:hypothetical protein
MQVPGRSIYYRSIYEIIVPQNITTKFSTLKLLFFSFSSCLTIERSIVFKTMDRQCESFSRIFSSATGLDKRFIFIRNTRTSSSINENSEIFEKISKFKNYKIFMISKFSKISVFIRFHKISKFSTYFKILKLKTIFFLKFKISKKKLKFQKFQKNSKFS